MTVQSCPEPRDGLAESIALILNENRHALGQVSGSAVEQLMTLLGGADRVFVVGEGRSGLAVRMAAMRLMHLGLRVHVVGEVTTPALRPGDLLLAVSGSGTTSGVLTATAKARALGGRIAAVTTQPESPLGQTADVVVIVPAAAKQDHGGRRSEQFAGSLFEQATLVLFDAVFHTLAYSCDGKAETLWAQHTNLE